MSPSKRITLKDVAEVAGVSSATVSYVLNDLGKVRPAVEEHVRAVANALGYKRNSAALALKTGRHNILGFLLPSSGNPVFWELANYATKYAHTHGYSMVFVDTENRPTTEAEMLTLMHRHGLDGAVAVLHHAFEMPTSLRFPVVSLDGEFSGLDSVKADHFQGGKLMAEHAYALGHRRIALVSGAADLTANHERRAGFLAGAASKLEILWEENVELDETLPPSFLTRLQNNRPSFIACVNDFVAFAVLNSLKTLNLRVPEDVSLCGFDNMKWCEWPIFSLTSVSQPLELLAKTSIDLLLARIQNPKLPPQNHLLPVQMIARTSTAPLPAPHN